MRPIFLAKRKTISDRIMCAVKVLAGAFLLLLLSCSESDSRGILPEGAARLSVSFRASDMSTRAPVVKPGEKSYNEDALHKLDIFLYPLAADGESQENMPAVYHLEASGLSADGQYEVKDYVLSKATLNALRLQSDGAECYIYAVANSPVAFDNDAMTVAEIKQQRIEASSFAEALSNGRKQKDFVMTGETKAQFTLAGAVLSGDIPLKRVAAKMEFGITKVEDHIVDAVGNWWVPDIKKMRIRLNNGVKATNMAGTDAVADDDYFVTKGYVDMEETNDANAVPYIHEFPFYSYPSNWDTGADNEAYATLIVPWARVKNDEDGKPIQKADGTYEIAGQYISTYYQIPVSTNAKGLFPNAYYRMNITVGIIGSFDPLMPVTVTDNSYIIVDWSKGTILPIAMKKINYLAVASNQVDMYNETEGSVEYITSDIVQTEVKIDSVSFVKYYGNDKDTYVTKILPRDGNSMKLYDDEVTISLNSFTVSKDNGRITLKTALDLTKVFVPITVSVSVEKSGLAKEEIKFRIYPPIYIIGNRSTANVYVDGKNYNNGRCDYGSVTNPTNVDGSGTNKNRNIYMIHVSSLSDGKYSIGDVRQRTPDKLSVSGLTNYYPTEKHAAGVYMLSPNFIIASSYGKTTAVSYANAQKRCATYQESGYPAGRWRIPTEGEIMFVIGLSDNKVFPPLFNGEYWAASGRAYSQDDNGFVNETGTTFVRCVYDIWYWGREHNATRFEWGDR